LLQTILPGQDSLVSVYESLDDGGVEALLESHVKRVGVGLTDTLGLEVVRKKVVDLFFGEERMLTTGSASVIAKNTLKSLQGEIAVAARLM
jgi:hypothetical protein